MNYRTKENKRKLTKTQKQKKLEKQKNGGNEFTVLENEPTEEEKEEKKKKNVEAFKKSKETFSIMATKPINIQRIRIVSQPY